MIDSLASARKAWRAIQALTGRALYGSQYQTTGGSDRIQIPTAAQSDHPFRATRKGNTIRFTPGIVSRQKFDSVYKEIVNDAGGYEYIPTSEGGTPVYLYIYIQASTATPSTITTNTGIYTGSYVVMPVTNIVTGAYGDVTYSPPAGRPFRYYWANATITHDPNSLSFVPPDVFIGTAYIPFLYITDTSMVQLIDKNISLNTLAAHRNLNLWP
jgi:type II secretory pathway pseudopilin PulG